MVCQLVRIDAWGLLEIQHDLPVRSPLPQRGDAVVHGVAHENVVEVHRFDVCGQQSGGDGRVDRVEHEFLGGGVGIPVPQGEYAIDRRTAPEKRGQA